MDSRSDLKQRTFPYASLRHAGMRDPLSIYPHHLLQALLNLFAVPSTDSLISHVLPNMLLEPKLFPQSETK